MEHDLALVAAAVGELQADARRRHGVVVDRLRRGLAADVWSARAVLAGRLVGVPRREALWVVDGLVVVVADLFEMAGEWYEQCADPALVAEYERLIERQRPDISRVVARPNVGRSAA